MSEERTLTVELEKLEGYSFKVGFGEDIEALITDEPKPIGQGKGPNATLLLAAAIGNCLSASLLFCLQKTRTPVKALGLGSKPRPRETRKVDYELPASQSR